MLKNYIRTALRNVIKHKTYSIINIAGLAIGMACFILIALYIQYELSYDTFHVNGDQIYRIVLNPGNFVYQGRDGFNVTPAPLMPTLKAECPEIVHITRLYKNSHFIQCEQKAFIENRFFYADPDFLRMFSFPLIAGNAENALDDPNSVLLTESMAKKYFGDVNPVGKRITVDQTTNYIITGIIQNTPKNSHFIFDFVASFSTLYKQGNRMETWDNSCYQTYVQLVKNASISALHNKFDEITKKYKGADTKSIFRLEPMQRIHLYGHRNFEIENNNDIRYIYLFGAIGLFILLIACFNYINISTSQAVKRAREVGLRKVVGASRTQLLRQFLSESAVFSFIGFFLALCLVYMTLPTIRSFLDKEFHLSLFSNFQVLIALFVILLTTGCLAGAYPAYLISAFQPVQILKTRTKSGSRSFLGLRNTLVIIQFIISAILIVCTITVYLQLNYIKDKKLGFKSDHIITLQLQDSNLQDNCESFITEISSDHRILNCSTSDCLPHRIRSCTDADWYGKDRDNNFSVYYVRVDNRFLDLYNISILDGQNFPADYSVAYTSFILNETAVKSIGWENAIGKNFGCNMIPKSQGRIVGVVEDFHYYPLHFRIQPLAIQLAAPNSKNWLAKYLSIKISSHDISGALSFIKNTWHKFSAYPFDYQFVDSQLDAMYKTEHKLGQLFSLFAFIAILLACLGLYGLVSFSIEQKIKEIGIRKALGATLSQIIKLLLREIVLCIVIANCIAWPVAWYLINKWLQEFAYRITIEWWIFVSSGILALLIAFFTMSRLTIRAATANPVEAIR